VHNAEYLAKASCKVSDFRRSVMSRGFPCATHRRACSITASRMTLEMSAPVSSWRVSRALSSSTSNLTVTDRLATLRMLLAGTPILVSYVCVESNIFGRQTLRIPIYVGKSFSTRGTHVMQHTRRYPACRRTLSLSMLAKHCLRSEIYRVSIDHIVSAVDGDAPSESKRPWPRGPQPRRTRPRWCSTA